MVHTILENALRGHAASRCMQDESVNRAGVRPAACDLIEQRAYLAVEGTRVWRGGLATEARECGVKILETPLGHPEFVAHQLQKVRQHQQTEFHPSLTCSSAWACCCIAQQQEPIISSGLCRLTQWPMMTRCGDVSVPCCRFLRTCARVALGRLASLPLAFGGIGLRMLQRPTGPVGATPWR